MAVRKHGNRWQVRVSVGGKRLERTVPPGATKADARALEAALLRRAVEVSSGRKPDRLIEEAIQEWLPTATTLKSWHRDIRYRLQILRAWTDGRRISELPEVASQVKKAVLESGLSPASANRYLAILRRLANLVEKWGWTDVSLFKRIALVPGEKHRHVYLTVEQVRTLADAADPKFRDFILMLVLTGLRRAELNRLTPEMIVGEQIVLDANTKSGRPRVVPMPPEALRIAQERLPWGYSESTIQRSFERARKAAGMPWVHLHDLRHTYASWLVQNGSSLVDVRDLLGHSSLSVTNRYAHLAPEHLRRAVSRLPRVSGGSGK